MADPKKMRPQKISKDDPRDSNKDGTWSVAEQKSWQGKSQEDVYTDWGYDLEVIKQLGLADFFAAQFDEYKKNPMGWSEEQFIRNLKRQPGFQQNSKAYQQDLEQELTFPEQYQASVNAQIETLRDQAVALGAQVDDNILRDLVVKQRRGGLNEAQMQNALSGYLTARGGVLQGKAGIVQQNLKTWAQRNGLGVSDNLIQDYVRKIQAGDTTEADVLSDLRRTYMAGAYPAWADKIAAGMDIADIAAPYKSAMAQLLETDESQIDLNDQLLQRGLQGVGADGKPSVVPLYAFQKEIRKDPRWQKTDNAYATYSSVADDILGMFGFR